MDREVKRKLMEGGPPSPEEIKRGDATSKQLAEEREQAIAEIAQTYLGVMPNHSDPIYTQHPVMAGIIRKALHEAYTRGQAAIITQIVLGRFAK